ncbi:PTS sugar transporter subunit IIA [Grimontia kaedaensis]|uniref:PTS sugar transporter subunit IIA n=1 Tax=Grimontia kaedaensis TaxID=2872157 RepID=UPI002072CEC8|nr:PTS sugar transporter subunit IIA [Grimontia kaedaensis]
MLSTLLSEHRIAVVDSVSDWKDAIHQVCAPLVKSGDIEPDYQSAIIDTTESLGPYYVLAPMIAMPHARPEQGVNNNALSLLVVRNGVEFHSEENDPVKLLLLLAVKDSDQHIERLMSFGNMPVSFEQTHIPVAVCDGFEFNQIEHSKYGYMEQMTGKKVLTREQDISAFNLRDSELAELLNVDEGQAMIELREVVSFDDGTPFEYTIATINSDLFNIHQVTLR